MACLIIARILVGFVPLKWWRRSLGKAGEPLCRATGTQDSRMVARSVIRATNLLPFQNFCLPRAMAVQWMLGRRGVHSALVFGIKPCEISGELNALHAWVEMGDLIVIGDNGESYHRGLVLAQ